jgi:hypothetical protein
MLLNNSVIIILSKQLTHSITVWDCGDNHNHINDYTGQEVGQDCQNHYVNLDIYG